MFFTRIRNIFLFLSFFLYISVKPVSAAILKLSPAADTFAKGDSFTVDVILDTENDQVMAADAVIDYDDQKLEATSAYLTDVFEAKVADGNIKNGQIIFSANDVHAVSGVKVIGKISFKVLADSGIANVKFVFNSGSVYNSLVAASGGEKVLNSVENAVYTIGNGTGGDTVTANTYSTTTPRPTLIPTSRPAPAHTSLPRAGNESLTLFLALFGLGVLALGFRSKLN